MTNHVGAVETLGRLANGPTPIDFLTPILSTMLAVSPDRASARVKGAAADYSKTIGLTDVLNGAGDVKKRHKLRKTYSPLTQISCTEDVDPATGIIAKLIEVQLKWYSRWREITRCIGELHDNVDSHSNGIGFSMAQVYGSGTNRRVEFAIADNGQGLLRNAQKADPSMKTEMDAIDWCLKEGNTSARNDDSWAQFWPREAGPSPFPKTVAIRSDGNHHQGLGLAILERLVRDLNGELFLWTGRTAVVIRGTSRTWKTMPIQWHGLVIEVCLTVKQTDEGSSLISRGDSLGRLLGL